MKLLLSNLRPAVSLVLLSTLLLGLAYPLALTAAGQALFPRQAGGSLIERDGRLVGSALIGQQFAAPQYLIGRPSAVGYDAASSGGSNLGPSSAELLESVARRVEDVRALDQGLPAVDRVTASASGLDPHLWLPSALQQAERIAARRGVHPDQVRALIENNLEGAYLGFVGEEVVNVLQVNLALDEAFPLANEPGGDADGVRETTTSDD